MAMVYGLPRQSSLQVDVSDSSAAVCLAELTVTRSLSRPCRSSAFSRAAGTPRTPLLRCRQLVLQARRRHLSPFSPSPSLSFAFVSRVSRRASPSSLSAMHRETNGRGGGDWPQDTCAYPFRGALGGRLAFGLQRGRGRLALF